MTIIKNHITEYLSEAQKVFLLLDDGGQYLLLNQAEFLKKFDAFQAERNLMLKPFAFRDVIAHECDIVTQQVLNTHGDVCRTDQYLTNSETGQVVEDSWVIWQQAAACFGMRQLSENNRRQKISHELKYLIQTYESSFGQPLGVPEALTFDKATTQFCSQNIGQLVRSLRT